jgi:hypothetical protein
LNRQEGSRLCPEKYADGKETDVVEFRASLRPVRTRKGSSPQQHLIARARYPGGGLKLDCFEVGETASGRKSKIQRMEEVQIDETFN